MSKAREMYERPSKFRQPTAMSEVHKNMFLVMVKADSERRTAMSIARLSMER